MLWLFANKSGDYIAIVCRKNQQYSYYEGTNGVLTLQRHTVEQWGTEDKPCIVLMDNPVHTPSDIDGIALEAPTDTFTIWGQIWKRVNASEFEIAQVNEQEIRCTARR